VIRDQNEFGSIIGPIERGIDELIEKAENPVIKNMAAKMKNHICFIKEQTPY